MSLGPKRRLITWGYFLGSTFVLVLLNGSQPGGTVGFFGWLVLANIVCTFWIVKIGLRLQKAIIPSVTCKNCGTLLDLTGLWKCSCGYTSQRPRHAFDTCQNCGAHMSYFNCPKCDTSIDLV